jgi:endonuclease/exonuclease/phosphatase family metal-dependent hydrolase
MNIRLLQRTAARVCAALLITAAVAAPAAAQTLRLTESSATVVRGGTYATTNFSADTLLATRASDDAAYVRRILLKFDTQNPIQQNAAIASATLTLTIAGGNAESRQLAAYRVANSYEETESTWTRRNVSAAWTKPGGDFGEVVATQTVTASVGSRVTYDVTALVQATVNASFGSSRYTRIAIVDTGASSRDSYKEFYSDEAGDVTVRPTLTVTLGAAPVPAATPAPTPAPAPAPAPVPAPASGVASLKVVDWNLHHGVGTDGVYDIDRIATALAKTGAHVISLNEVERFTSWGNEDQPARIASLLKAKTGKTWYYNFASNTGAANGQGVLLLSTYPIESSADYLISFSRVVAQIRIIVNGRTVNVFSTHTDPDSASRRTTQMTEIKSWMSQFPEARIIAGDFNTWPSAGEIPQMTGTYFDTWAVAASAGTAVAYAGNTAGNTRNSRIDYVFLSRGATPIVIKGAQVFDVRNASGVMPSDHRPVMGIFEVR